MKTAQHITRIEIQKLWPGGGHIVWHLKAGVNVLSGRNGAGKSTLIARIAKLLSRTANADALPCAPKNDIEICYSPETARSIPFDWIRSYDTPLIASEGITHLEEGQLRSELDWQLYLLQRRYLDYQVKIANRIIAALSEQQEQSAIAQIAARKQRFQDIVDELFADTKKSIDRNQNELSFCLDHLRLCPYALSSGEKQLLLILLTVLCQDGKPYLLLMDEPEASLHFDWQQRLITLIRELNPAVQIILSTHSPALILDGWEDEVTEISDLFV